MIKQSIFIFSSPLQYLFSILIAKQIKKSRRVLGYYYYYDKDFFEVYNKISNYLNYEFEIIETLDKFRIKDVDNNDEIYFGNRYNDTEISVFFNVRGRCKNLNLYEEGFNTYLPHHFNDHNHSEFNFINSTKNTVKEILGKSPNLIKLDSFSEIYTCFKMNWLKDKSKWREIKFIDDRPRKFNNEMGCLFLSQSLAEDKFVDEEIYVKFLNLILNRLSKIYDVIYFKPHPRNNQYIIESISIKFKKVRFLPEIFSELPAELFLSKNNVHLIGFSSSTLMYASSLFKTEVFQCLEELVEFSSSIRLKKLLFSMKPIFNKHRIKSLKTYL